MLFQSKVIALASVGSIFGGASLFASAFADTNARTIPQIVPLPVEKIYVPLGFDDNDNSEAIVHGQLPSTCYKLGNITKTQTSENEIEISGNALYYPNAYCLQMQIPFTTSVPLGVLKKGEYNVTVKSAQGLTDKLDIAVSKTENADDFLYAPVDSVDLQSVATPTEAAGSYKLTLKGRFPHMLIGCMVMNRVVAKPQKGNMLIVQPVAEIVDDERCSNLPPDLSFSETVTVQTSFEENVLVHVRSLNGQSLNRHYDAVD